jgi:hypothetical protein
MTVSPQKNIIIDCATCRAVVAAEVVAESQGYDEENSIPLRYQFASCPNCSGPLLVERYDFGDDEVDYLSTPVEICGNLVFAT